MREDMFKVIVERPRRASRMGTYARKRLSGEDDLPSKIGVKRHLALTRRRDKYLNENLKPLKRYLLKQVGRPWDKVFSEISATLDPGHTVKEHVRSHIDDFVARRVSFGRDGTWMSAGRGFRSVTPAPWYQLLYVDPRDGILKESAKLWRKLGVKPRVWRHTKPEPDKDIRRIDDMRELRGIEGIWYEIRYGTRDDGTADETAFDLVRRVHVPATQRHACAKRQLSAAELDAHGLTNETDLS